MTTTIRFRPDSANIRSRHAHVALQRVFESDARTLERFRQESETCSKEGDAHLNAGRIAAASSSYGRALEFDPSNASALLGSWLLRSGLEPGETLRTFADRADARFRALHVHLGAVPGWRSAAAEVVDLERGLVEWWVGGRLVALARAKVLCALDLRGRTVGMGWSPEVRERARLAPVGALPVAQEWNDPGLALYLAHFLCERSGLRYVWATNDRRVRTFLGLASLASA